MTWTYIVLPDGCFTTKSIKDDDSIYLGKLYIAPSNKKKPKTLARESTSDIVKVMPSPSIAAQEIHLSPEFQVLDQYQALQETPSFLEDEGEGRYAPYVGLPFNLHRDLKVDNTLERISSDALA